MRGGGGLEEVNGWGGELDICNTFNSKDFFKDAKIYLNKWKEVSS